MNNDKDSRGLSGLGNLGNTCYMNATLQCLFATDLFNYYIKCGKFKYDLQNGITQLEIDKHKHLLKTNQNITLEELTEFIKSKKSFLKNNFKNSITYSLYQVFTLMWGVNCTVKPKKLKEIIAYYFPKFEGNNQHDSEEFLYALFDRINDETKTDIKIKKFKVSHEISKYYNEKKDLLKQIKHTNDNDPERDQLVNKLNKLIVDNFNNDIIIRSIEYWKNYFSKNYSIISKIFTGMFTSEIRCTGCNNYNVNFETFNVLELSLYDKEGKIMNNLEDCIKQFCEPETIENYKCDNCKNIGTALKKASIFQLPPKLIIQLKRFSSKQIKSNNMMSRLLGGKINDLINFPLYNLDLSIAQNDIKPITDKYNLYATVNHSGGLNGGHYVANCKNLLDKKWYHFNDSTVSYINDDKDIINDSTYVLFYEKS